MIRVSGQMVLLSLLSLCSIQVIAEEEFGRFFSTPEQRRYLDELKSMESDSRAVPRQQTASDIRITPAQPQRFAPVTVKGVVYRLDGNSTAWINDGNTYDGDIDQVSTRERNIRTSGVTLEHFEKNRRYNLKVGETLDPNTGRILDLTEQTTPAQDARQQGPGE